MVAIFCMLGRTAFTTVALVWQKNNMKATYRASHTFTDEDIYEREMGSKLTLVNRAVYNLYIWIQKGVVLLLYHRMLAGVPLAGRVVKFYWAVLFLTLVQVVPDPGLCTTAVIQLYVLATMKIFTDILLILLPMPWILRIKRSLTQRLQLVGLFSIGIGLIIIAIYRLPLYGSSTTQVNRNTLGSIEGFFAAFVANILTLFTLRKQRPKDSTLDSEKASNTGLSSGTKDVEYARYHIKSDKRP